MTHSTGARSWRRVQTLLAAVATMVATPALPAQRVHSPVLFHLTLGHASATSVSGRLLVFARLLSPADKRPVAAVNMDQIDTHATAIAAQEVTHLEPGVTHIRRPPSSARPSASST